MVASSLATGMEMPIFFISFALSFKTKLGETQRKLKHN